MFIKTIAFLVATSLLLSSNMDSLITDINNQNDLSKLTIDENKGHFLLFTRNDIEKRHANTLKNILKTTPAIYYHENRHGLPYPLSGVSFSPYLSSFIRELK